MTKPLTYGMNLRSHWENDKKLFQFLASLLKYGKISIVLGSGISVDFGLPDWDTFVKQLYDTKKEPLPTKGRPERLVENFRRKHGKDHLQFMEYVQEALYLNSRIDFNALKELSTVSAIGTLVMASKRGSISNVITFNFDNILELYLSYHGYIVNSRYQELHWNSNADVNIYHVHGFVPNPPSKDFSDKITLDQHSYSSVIGDESNPWRQHILSIMRSNFCIFIGLSGDDMNLDSLLDRAHKTHVALSEKKLFWGLNFIKNPDQDTIDFWEERGIFVKSITDYNSDLPNLLYKICQMAALLH
jgi:hypothetical protein